MYRSWYRYLRRRRVFVKKFPKPIRFASIQNEEGTNCAAKWLHRSGDLKSPSPTAFSLLTTGILIGQHTVIWMTLTNRKPPSPYYQQCEERKPWGISNPWTGKSASLLFGSRPGGRGSSGWLERRRNKSHGRGRSPSRRCPQLEEPVMQGPFLLRSYVNSGIKITMTSPASYRKCTRNHMWFGQESHHIPIQIACNLHPFIFYGCKLSVLGIGEYLTKRICRFKEKKKYRCIPNWKWTKSCFKGEGAPQGWGQDSHLCTGFPPPHCNYFAAEPI